MADTNNHRIRLVEGEVSTHAGGGPGFQDGALPAALLNEPSALALDLDGKTLHVADSFNHRILTIAGGQVTTLAGSGATGATGGDHLDAPLGGSRLGYPRGLALDAAGRIYVADVQNHCVRVIRRW